ncbi:bobby sox [Arctopsyche grandis]|uniref:bobby sox n=1 Tax=Arctopsyche grandis TaxID=121162 RepID=UPI00406D8C4F
MTELEDTPIDLPEGNTHCQSKNVEIDVDPEPSHHARRPMNAFLIFCKRHRSVVRDKYPNLENRSITKILGEWWANLDKEDKACYTGLAKQYKDAFFSANPGFKWYKLPAPPLRTFSTRPSNNHFSNSYNEQENYNPEFESCNVKTEQTNNNHIIKSNYDIQPSTSKLFPEENKSMFTPGKLADEAQMGGISSLIVSNSSGEADNDVQNINDTKTRALVDESVLISSAKSDIPMGRSIPNPPPKKRPFLEDNQDAKSSDKTEALSSNNKLSASETKLQKLQDALSETSRLFEMLDSDCSEKKSSFTNYNNNGNESDISSNSVKSDNTTKIDDLSNHSSPSENSHQLNTDIKSSELKTENGSDNYYKMKQFDIDCIYEKSENSWMKNYEKSECKLNGRSCKGKRYQEFMAFGGLLVNKRNKKDHLENKLSYKQDLYKSEGELNNSTNRWKICENFFQNDRLNSSEESQTHNKKSSVTYIENKNFPKSAYENRSEINDTGQDKETLDNIGNKMFKASDFDLDAKIKALPSLSLEKFQQKKKENKKRKKNSCKQKDAKSKISKNIYINSLNNSHNLDHHLLHKISGTQTDFLNNSHEDKMKQKLFMAEEHKTAIIGSRKRKPRKISITRIDSKLHAMNSFTKDNEIVTKTTSISVMPDQNLDNSIDMCGLTTLAEVAANIKM